MSSGNVDSGISHEIGVERQAPLPIPTESLPVMVGDQDIHEAPTISEQIPSEVQTDNSNSVARIKRCHRLGASGSGFFVKRLV